MTAASPCGAPWACARRAARRVSCSEGREAFARDRRVTAVATLGAVVLVALPAPTRALLGALGVDAAALGAVVLATGGLQHG